MQTTPRVDAEESGSGISKAAARGAFRIWIVLLLLLSLVGALRLSVRSSQMAGIDFYQYWALAQSVDEELVPNVYHSASRPYLAQIFLRRSVESGSRAQMAAADFRIDELQAASTPFLYTVFHAIQTGVYDRDIVIYRAMTLLGSLVSVLLLCRMLGASPLKAAVALAFLCWLFSPLRDDLADGNVNQVQLMLLTGFLWLHQSDRGVARAVAAGAVLGLATFFKPNLAFSLLCLATGFAVCGRWLALLRCSVGAALGGMFAVAVSSVFFGSWRAWPEWFEVLRHLDQSLDVAVAWGNFGGARLLREALGVDLSAGLSLTLLGIVFVAFWRGQRRRVPGRLFCGDFLLVSVGAVVPILSMGLAWPHYLMLAVPLLVYIFVRPVDGPSWRRSPAIGVLGALALLGVSSGMAMDAMQISAAYPRAIALSLGTLMLFAAGAAELLRLGSEETESTRA